MNELLNSSSTYRWVFAINVFKGIVQLFDIPSGDINDRSEPYAVYLLSDESLTVHFDFVSKSLQRLKMTIVRRASRRTGSGEVDYYDPVGLNSGGGGGEKAPNKPGQEKKVSLLNNTSPPMTRTTTAASTDTATSINKTTAAAVGGAGEYYYMHTCPFGRLLRIVAFCLDLASRTRRSLVLTRLLLLLLLRCAFYLPGHVCHAWLGLFAILLEALSIEMQKAMQCKMHVFKNAPKWFLCINYAQSPTTATISLSLIYVYMYICIYVSYVH
jgi:hypothetical protein